MGSFGTWWKRGKKARELLEKDRHSVCLSSIFMINMISLSSIPHFSTFIYISCCPLPYQFILNFSSNRSNMKTPTLLALIVLLSSFTACCQGSGTKITFFVEHEVDEQKDYLQIIIDIKAEDTSLKEAFENAEETVKYIRNLIEDHCKTNTKKKGECQEITESGKFNVEPQYRLIKGEPVFIAFSVSYEVTGKILHTENVGPLVDKINRRDGTHISSLEWQAFDENEEEIATVGEGIEQAEKRCKNLGLALGEIESIDEVADFQLEEQPAEDEQQEEQEQEEPEVIKYKFVVQCVGKQAKKK